MGWFDKGEKTKSLKNIEMLLSTLVANPEKQEAFTEEEMRRAAYALNMCMVSVSQIIDYDDIYILEQEYDAILNNLNLEVMPKDEALLDILKQLLNTITFFRMQEGDKKIQEKEYQDKMKNAIWSAVPNVGMLVAGGNPITMAISLASQVGIGYMNYRKAKSQIILDKEKSDWQLERSAMEQFHGLRRELFDTAWRLADKYNFPDEYRITEQQITRFNEILLDNDDLRRYERLAYIQDKCEAYPPFWYYLGKAANAVYQDNSYSSEVRGQNKSHAIEHFKEFLEQTERNLFREDLVLASCALEYFELLIQSGCADRPYLKELIAKAIGAAGNSHDVLELCALAYLQLGSHEEAAKLLRMLVNEDYNKTINAQFLSSLYVAAYIRKPDPMVRTQYETLATRVHPKFLFPMPAEDVGKSCDQQILQDAFLQAQRRLIYGQCSGLLQELIAHYTMLYNRSFPGPEPGKEYPDWFFSNDVEAKQDREDAILKVFESEKKRIEYMDRLQLFTANIFHALNALYASIQQLPFVDQDQFFNWVAEKIKQNHARLLQLQQLIIDRTMDADDGRKLISFSFEMFTETAFQMLVKDLIKHIESLQDMAAVASTESAIRRFCQAQQIALPEWSVTDSNATASAIGAGSVAFDLSLLSENSETYQIQMNKTNEMFACLRDFVSENSLIVPGAKKIQFYKRGDPAFNDYINRHLLDLGGTLKYILAVINDTSYSDEDVLITTEGIRIYWRFLFVKALDEPSSYTVLQESGWRGMPANLKDKELYTLVKQLAEIEARYAPKLAAKDKGTMASRLSAQLHEASVPREKQKAITQPTTVLEHQSTANKHCELYVRAPLKTDCENQFRATGKTSAGPLCVGDQFALIHDGRMTDRIIRIIQIGWGDRQSAEKEAGAVSTILLEGDFQVYELEETTFVKI